MIECDGCGMVEDNCLCPAECFQCGGDIEAWKSGRLCWTCERCDEGEPTYIGDGERYTTEFVLRQTLRQIVDPSYVGNYPPAAVVEIYRKWAAGVLAETELAFTTDAAQAASPESSGSSPAPGSSSAGVSEQREST